LLNYLGNNIRNVKAEQIQDTIAESLQEGGEIMKTVFQQLLERGKKEGVKEGKEIGVKEGEERGKMNIALSCLRKGMEVDIIADITGLPLKKIEELKVFINQPEAA